MKYVDVMKYCLSLPQSRRSGLSPTGNAFALMVGEKTFGYFETAVPIQWQFSLRVSPEHFVELPNPPQVRQANNAHDGYWITIQRVENFNAELLRELIAWSYQQAIE
ncbi:MAG: hypothetical protein CMK83_17820 [Pseudomonadales bacterium]|jgi:predicted DNA-binding protein (MmcQ/YjbR family)|uniref:hypothetical protein n=1 Tax=unclassified Ketobacter TaxID=2639109 RepID=UPI000C60A804|nr:MULTISPECIES: hypothetical protein [unclassified Ketobacter]MAA60547.1 hypothetical protein [Pseudomonadales bacterium]MEC8812292.1 hypothetical protein [Pseudomonadota bacterium]TNC87824.1 MAG: hypothetical protein CSH49_14125 [Alcanivorax sp.]HAG93274.1 hypothetical protein [Gammaproteobacteria bacterium]MAQ26066.1 hypothetical protein [Pseudomonadales bacterium]|tara:strand:- start:76 stop:396 length:321 start_codon:yes stop_codon:yes gene_type:complete